jgi:O-antigen/teichoic acid export membrane protein
MNRVRRELKTLLAVSSFIMATSLVLSYVLLRQVGINGVGLAWLGSQGIAAVVVLGFLMRKTPLGRN